MIRKHILRVSAITLFLLSFLTAPGFGGDSEMSRATLAGLQGVTVVVEDLQPNVQKYAAKFDLSGAQIRRDVEQKPRGGGIRVVEGNEWLNIPGRPVLCVHVNTHESEKYWYAYDIKIELRQLAILEANPKVRVLASTWSISLTGSANIGNLNLIRQDVGVLAGRFVQAYKTVNSKQ